MDLGTPSGTVAQLTTKTEAEFRTTWNVLAETAKGDPDNVVMAGAHLDSVVAGPGVNDNGSGSASILEVAEQLRKVTPTNKVRFAWWGAEELGLLGSHHYVDDLVDNDPATLKKIASYLNLDMVGSPNYVRFVYDGDNSRFPVGLTVAEGPDGSGEIEKLFHDYFGSQELASEETPFSGRRDYGPFTPRASPRAACSPAPRAPRPRNRRRFTAVPPGRPTTRATTRPATTSTTSTWTPSTRCPTPSPTRS